MHDAGDEGGGSSESSRGLGLSLGTFEPVQNNRVFESPRLAHGNEMKASESMRGEAENTLSGIPLSAADRVSRVAPLGSLGHDSRMGEDEHFMELNAEDRYGHEQEADSEKEYEKLIREASKYLTARKRRALVAAVVWILVLLSLVQFLYLTPLIHSDTTTAEALRLHREQWWQLVFTKWSNGLDAVQQSYDDLQELYSHAVTWHDASIHTAPQCKNTAQGPFFITDERGNYCLRTSLDANSPGCCLPEESQQYTCEGCEDRCCPTFEVCVSCCLGDDAVTGLAERYEVVADDNSSEGQKDSHSFEVCTALCRTSSESITDDNFFVKPELRFCHAV